MNALRQPFSNPALRRHLGREHVLPMLFFGVLSILISWPTVMHFTTTITSSGDDARHELWLLWHTREAILGRQPFSHAPYLFYPRGATLLTHSTGPVTGFLALPFWPFGHAAAYNGTLVVGLTLTGYSMYLLARSLGLPVAVSIFAGCMLLSAPMTIAGLNQHLTKVFAAGMPLVLLALLRALDPETSHWWTAGVGVALLFVLLHNGYQFVYISLAVGFFTLVGIFVARPSTRRTVIQRSMLAAASTLLFVGPLLFPILRAASDPELKVAVSQDSFERPDLIQFLVPDHSSYFWSAWARRQMEPFIDQVTLDVETSVALPWIGVLLCVPLLLRRGRPARRWLLFTALCIVFALGPLLQVRGRSFFTTYELPVILPYAFLTSLRGLEFMRTPGRFMQIGAIGLGITASYGLLLLIQRFPRWRYPLVVGALALLLLQNWPRPFPQERLRPVPEFYKQLARDPEIYGVFDLPLKYADGFSYGLSYITYSAYAQLYQMTHRKGIHGAYLSRTYDRHPIFQDLMDYKRPELLINGVPAPFVNFEPTLARNGYRYVVLHTDEPDELGFGSAKELLRVVYGEEQPVAKDDLVTVYRVAPDPATLMAWLGTGWLSPEENWRWTMSPATITVESPCTQQVTLEILPVSIHSPEAEGGLGAQGNLNVQVGSGTPRTVPLTVEQVATIPLSLPAGTATITLSLEAGNFQPLEYGGDDDRVLSFATRTINLQTGSGCS